jgi:hypothetical protein
MIANIGTAQLHPRRTLHDLRGQDLEDWPVGDVGHRLQGTPPSRGAVTVHQHQRHRFTAFTTDAKKGQLADLELRHRRRARCGDRICNVKHTGLRNLPFKHFARNQVWWEIIALACVLLAWTQMLALTGKAHRWEPKWNPAHPARQPGSQPLRPALPRHD